MLEERRKSVLTLLDAMIKKEIADGRAKWLKMIAKSKKMTPDSLEGVYRDASFWCNLIGKKKDFKISDFPLED